MRARTESMGGPSRWRYLAAALWLLLAAVIAWAAFTPSGRITVKTALFMPNLIPNFPIRPITWFTPSPHRAAVTFSGDASTWSGDLYLPDSGGPHPGIVVALGVNPAGRDDPRVRNLGDGLARMGVAALVPISDDLTNKRVTPGDVDLLVAAFQYLAQRPEVAPSRVGFLGISVGASLSMLAAQDPRISGQVNFVNWFGGYYRLDELIAAVVSRHYVRDGRTFAWTPDSLTDEVVRLRLIDLVDDPAERDLLRRDVLGRQPLTAGEQARLSAAAATVLRLQHAGTPQEAQRLIGELPQQAQDLIKALSPATHLDRTRARLYLMGDRDDTLIPFVETRALAGGLDGRYQRYSEFSIFSHVSLDRLANPAKSVPQLWSLFLHVRAIFESIR